MAPSLSAGRIIRPWAFLALALTLSGCGESDHYPADMKYSVRSDFFLRDIPKTQPPAFDTPGHMPLDFLATLPRRFDPDTKTRVIDIARVEQMVKDGALQLNAIQKGVLEEYKANNVIDPRNLTAGERNKIGDVLTKLFGTPANPIVKVKGAGDDMGITQEASDRLKLDAKTLQEGSALYRRHCLHCHGLEGNGRGPTAFWVNPHPRDYRKGIFKFTSSTQELGERKPRRDDLMHVVLHGIEGSSMPSFNMYPHADLEKIVSYVIHLSMRGEIECYVIDKWFQESKMVEPPSTEEVQQVRASMAAQNKPAAEVDKAIKDMTDLKAPPPEQEKTVLAAMDAMFNEALEGFTPRWIVAQDSPIIPDPYPYEDTEEAMLTSAARGAVLFNTGTASCVSCHKNLGRESPHYFDTWGTIVRPRNLAEGYMRGGRRPIDLYYRIWSGIPGSGMASYDKELRPKEDDKAGKIDRMWDLVNFMQVVHYPDLRAKLRARGVQID